MRNFYLILSCLFLSIGSGMSQTTFISGIILDSDEEPLAGVSVVVKGTTVGTFSDSDGKFSIENNSADKVLVFLLIGHKTLELPGENNMRVIMLRDSELLDEVMVVAYGSAKRSAFTGSAAVIPGYEISKRQSSNITGTLSGQVAGVQVTNNNGQPGEDSEIRIRGIGSINANNKPLYVVDGIPYDGQLSSINPSDIESVTVLKDAASNALYGARGANGVILINTRSGSYLPGKSQDATITLDAKWGTNRRAIPSYKVLKNPATYYEKVYEAIYNGRMSSGNATPEEAHNYANSVIFTDEDGGVGYRVYNIPDGEDFILSNGKINPNATLGYSDGSNYFIPDNWEDEIYNSGNLREEYNIGISGGTDRMNYYLSGGYLKDSGIIPNSGFERYSSRMKTDYKAKKWLKVGANMSYSKTTSNYPSEQDADNATSSANLFYVSSMIAPIYPMYVRDADGSIMTDARGYKMYDYGDMEYTDYYRPFMNMSNPYGMLKLDKREFESDVFSGQWFADIRIYDGLKATAKLGIDSDNRRFRGLYNKYYGQYAEVGGAVYVGQIKQTGQTGQFLVSYDKYFHNHHIDVLAGYESYEYRYRYQYGSKENIYDGGVIELDNAINNPASSSYADSYTTEGYLSRIQYDYSGEFFGSVSFRRDGSSRFHKDNRWGNFWSFGGAWLLSKRLLSKHDQIDLLKFKASFGQQGNDNLFYRKGTNVNYYPGVDQSKLEGINGNYALNSTYIGDKNITWETSHSFNTGFDFDFWKGMLSGSAEYFSRKTTDMLYYKPVSSSGGYDYLPENVGSVRNQGFELDLNSLLINNKDFKWNVNLNITWFKNKILKLSPNLPGYFVDGTRIYKEGSSMYTMYLRKFAGVDSETGESLWYKNTVDANGNITGRETTNSWSSATPYETKDLLPKVYGGFGTSVYFCGFDASVSFSYQLGGHVYDQTYAWLMHGGTINNAGMNWHQDILKSWNAENTNTNVPMVNTLGQNINSLSDRFLVSSDYLALQNISFGYTLPKKLTERFDIENIRLYFVADNVALVSARKGLDSRQTYAVSGSYVYAPIRSISGGISLTF